MHKTVRQIHKVLVTDADSIKALAVVRALGKNLEVWTASPSRFTAPAFSRYTKTHIVWPKFEPMHFADQVLETCTRNAIDIVLSLEEQSSFLLSQDFDRFLKNKIILTVPPFEALKIAMDKGSTIEVANQVGVPVPPTISLDSYEAAIEGAHQLGYPIVIKPRFSHFWDGEKFTTMHGVMYANSDYELKHALAIMPTNIPPPILQKFVSGKGVGIFVAIGSGGTLKACFAHERLRDLRPTGSGSVLRRSVSVDDKLCQMSVKLLKAMNWWGVAMVEFRKNEENGKVYLMEVNGRFWGSLQLAIDAGVNFPQILVDIALGKEVKMPSYKNGVIVRWWLGDLHRLLRVLRGRPIGFTGDFPSRISGLKTFLGRQPVNTINEVFRRDDPWPAIGEILYYIFRKR